MDYKTSAAFRLDDSFSLKLIKHIHGFANSGGGWLVIGYLESEDQGLTLDPSHTDSICASYDPTVVSQQVASSLARGQQIRITLHLEVHPDTGLRHPIIQVEGFQRTPCVCRSDRVASDTGEQILRQTDVYVRRPGAETSRVSTPQDWEELIDRCVRLRRDELLSEFKDLFERMTSPSSQPSPVSEELSAWMTQMRDHALEDSKEGGAS